MTEDNKEGHKKEEKHKGNNPFIQRLVNSMGKKITVVDTEGTKHEGKLLAYSQPYLNLCLHVDNNIRFIRNISWFERPCDDVDKFKPKPKND